MERVCFDVKMLGFLLIGKNICLSRVDNPILMDARINIKIQLSPVTDYGDVRYQYGVLAYATDRGFYQEAEKDF